MKLASSAIYIILLAVFIFCRAAYAQEPPNWDIKVQYDSAKDITMIVMTVAPLAGKLSEKDLLAFGVVAVSPGKMITNAQRVWLLFINSGPTERYIAEPNRRLEFSIDGNKSNPGPVEEFGSEKLPNGGIYQEFRIAVDLDTLKQMAYGSSVDGKLGIREFRFSSELLKRLIEFVIKLSDKKP